MNESGPPISRRGLYSVWIVAGTVLMFLLAPVVIIVLVSFSAADYLQFPPPSLSLKWYRKFWEVTAWRESIIASVKVALVTMMVATLVGVLASLALTRAKFRWKAAVYGLVLSPMIVPTIVTAAGYYFLAAKVRLVGNLIAIAMGQTVLALPIVVIIVSATLQGFDVRLEQAAYSLGAGRWFAFRRVTLPLIGPGVASAALFAFLASFDDLLIPLFLSGVQIQTLTVRIWNSLQVDLDPTIAAVSSFLIAVTVAVLGISAAIGRRDVGHIYE